MNIKSVFVNLGKLLLCGIVFSIGTIIGGMVVTTLGLQQPPMPEGMDGQSAMFFLLLESPLLALILVPLARHLSGGFWARTVTLASLTWISNAVNNQIEASAFAGMGSGFLFTIVTFLFPVFFISMAVTWLFPPAKKNNFTDAVKSFFGRYSVSGWIWRLVLAAVIFMPIYYFFGLLVVPFTSEYYAQNLYGLEIPSMDRLLKVLLLRSVLFLVACLPVLIAWQSSKWNLAWRLGLALFYLVGFQSLLIANWMPLALRFPHMLEIMAGEFVYAAALVWLIGKNQTNIRCDPISDKSRSH